MAAVASDDITFTRIPLPAKPSAEFDAVTPQVSSMHADDARALRLVSAIIFTVVALGTLAMFGTVLICD